MHGHNFRCGALAGVSFLAKAGKVPLSVLYQQTFSHSSGKVICSLYSKRVSRVSRVDSIVGIYNIEPV